MFSRTKIQCDLRLDQSCIFLPSEHYIPHDRPSISGVLRLSLQHTAPVKSISVSVNGKEKLYAPASDPRAFEINPSRPCDEYILFRSHIESNTVEWKQTLASSRTLNSFTLPAGSYEFPFKIALTGRAIESIIGPEHDYHSYRVHAHIQRSLDKDIIISQPVRIYRAFKLWELPLNSISNSSDHVQYSVSVTDANIPFGSTFPVSFQIAPLRKGLAIDYITLAVLEKHELKIPASASYAGQTNLHFFRFSREYQLLSQTYNMSGEDLIGPESSDLCWSTIRTVSLPQEQGTCTQNVASDTIKITHSLAFTIGFSEVEGQSSFTITGSLPFNIFMSPFGPTDDGSIFEPDLAHLAIHGNSPPPLYSDHKIDLKLSDGESFDHYTESPVPAPPYTRLCEGD